MRTRGGPVPTFWAVSGETPAQGEADQPHDEDQQIGRVRAPARCISGGDDVQGVAMAWVRRVWRDMENSMV